MIEFIAQEISRLDKFIALKVEVSRGRVQKAIKDGKVYVNGKVVTEPDFEISSNDKVVLPEFSDELEPSKRELKIVFENSDLAVIDKPAGMVVHPGAGKTVDTLAQALISRYPDIKTVGDPHRPGIVHRLDEDTSGLIVIAKTSAAYDFLKKTFQERDIQKEYLALVHGKIEKLHGFIDLPITKAPSHRKMKIGEGKEALTEYSLVASDGAGQFSLIRVKLHTGRTHQIRVHMNAIGHPLVGDSTYGKFKKQDETVIGRQFLHASRLKFKLMDGTLLELASPMPSDLKEVLSKVGITYEDRLI